ncbi:hypothetical protein RI367_003087 [Sorochytrium milnesiophthora]
MQVLGTDVADDGNVFVIVLTGGPCAGKSTVQTMLSDVLENMGYKVYRVPETATILLSCGVAFAELDEEQVVSFQENLLRVMMQLEQTMFDLARLNARNRKKKTVVICNRGTMDPSAYCERKVWLQILRRLGLNEVDIRDNRYDIVYGVHLVTAADGAESFYHSPSNAAYVEDIDLARELDNLVKHAWIGHPYFSIVDNSTGFDQKCTRVVETVLNRLGMTGKHVGENVRKVKFLVKSFDSDAEFPVPYRDFEVEHRYLQQSENGAQLKRIRRRTDGSGTSQYNITTRKAPKEGQRIEERRSLAPREYEALKLHMDPTRSVIVKTRRCFHFNNRYFQLDTFRTPCTGLMLLEAYIHASYVPVMNPSPNPADPNSLSPRVASMNMNLSEVLPSFVDIDRDVTDDPAYSMFELAKKD